MESRGPVQRNDGNETDMRPACCSKGGRHLISRWFPRHVYDRQRRCISLLGCVVRLYWPKACDRILRVFGHCVQHFVWAECEILDGYCYKVSSWCPQQIPCTSKGMCSCCVQVAIPKRRRRKYICHCQSVAAA